MCKINNLLTHVSHSPLPHRTALTFCHTSGRDEELQKLRGVYQQERDERLRQVQELFENMVRG